jgi:hypothetical protein
VVHTYPTWADGVWNAALAEAKAAMTAPKRRRAIGLIMRLRRAVSRD